MMDVYCSVLDNGQYVVQLLVKKFNLEFFVDWMFYFGYDYVVYYDISVDLKLFQELVNKLD